jgi:hypothetical protein
MSLNFSGTPPGIDTGTVRLVAQGLNHYATPGPGYFADGIEYSGVIKGRICGVAKELLDSPERL